MTTKMTDQEAVDTAEKYLESIYEAAGIPRVNVPGYGRCVTGQPSVTNLLAVIGAMKSGLAHALAGYPLPKYVRKAKPKTPAKPKLKKTTRRHEGGR